MNTKDEKKHAIMLLFSMYMMQIAVTGFMFGPLSLFADPICQDWGILRTQYSVVLTMGTLLNAILSMTIYGPLETRIGMKKVMILGGTLVCGGFGVLSLAHGLPLLYLGGAMFGCGAAFLSNNTINTVITRRFAKRQGIALGTIRTIGSFSSTVGSALVGAWIYNANLGYSRTFMIITAIGIVCFIAWMMLYRGDPADLGERPMYADELEVDGSAGDAYEYGPTSSATWRNPQYWLLGLCYVCIGFVSYALIGCFALFCVDYGFEAQAGTALSALWFAAAVLSLPAGLICDKWKSRTLITICVICIAIGAFIFRSESLPLSMVYVVAVLCGFGYTSNLVPVGISVREAFGTRDYSKKIGLAVGGMILGMSISPIVMNAFYDFGGQTYSMGLLLVIVLCAVAAVLSFISTREVKE